MTPTEKINKAIKESNGSLRDALNVALTKIELLEVKLDQAKKDYDSLQEEIQKLL